VILARHYLGTALFYGTLHALLVVYPQALFPYQRAYKNFTMHMREPVPPEVTRVLDRADSLLSASPLNEEKLHHRIYLINSFRLSRFLLLRNVHFGCRLSTGAIFITHADVANDVARCERISRDDRRVRTLSETIVHEITHGLIRRRVGWRAERRLPTWLKEGYCEYVADGSAIDHRVGLSLLKSTTPSFTPGLQNFRYRLVVEYLINVRGMTVGELLQHPPEFEVVESEVIAALRENEQAFLDDLGSRIGRARQLGPDG
jgi:hypothetical protein